MTTAPNKAVPIQAVIPLKLTILDADGNPVTITIPGGEDGASSVTAEVVARVDDLAVQGRAEVGHIAGVSQARNVYDKAGNVTSYGAGNFEQLGAGEAAIVAVVDDHADDKVSVELTVSRPGGAQIDGDILEGESVVFTATSASSRSSSERALPWVMRAVPSARRAASA